MALPLAEGLFYDRDLRVSGRSMGLRRVGYDSWGPGGELNLGMETLAMTATPLTPFE